MVQRKAHKRLTTRTIEVQINEMKLNGCYNEDHNLIGYKIQQEVRNSISQQYSGLSA